MNTPRIRGWLEATSLVMVLLWTGTLSAQTFSSGSTGADGAFAPAATTTITLPPNGVFNFTTVTIPSGVTVTFAKNAANTPVTILATGTVTVAGTISVNGTTGATGMTSGPLFNPGAGGGPGGFAGGQGGARDGSSLPSQGHGPGGGQPDTVTNMTAGSYGAPASFVSLLPLFGGSGGGGASASGASGASGGGGGGAIVIASSSSITVNGTITAKGGDGGGNGTGGSGSGGAIRLVAQQITGTGTINADGGTGGGRLPGRIRFEAFTLGFNGTVIPVAPTTPVVSTSTSPGPVTASSTPALINLPTLTISTVAGGAAPTTPGGSYATADVSLPSGTTNPVSVTLTTTNTPVGTVFTVRLLPQFGVATSVSSFASTGSFATSTATANVNFPTGQVSVLNAFGSFTLPQIASLFPLIEGEEVDRIMVAAAYGEPSPVTLVTTSGREIPVDRLSNEDQVRVAIAFDTLRKLTP